MPKKRALKIILKSAQNYKAKLNNCDFLIYYYEKKELLHKEITFSDSNFLHLTGVITALKPKDFFDNLVLGKFLENDFELRKDGATMQKLDVLEKLHNVFYSSAMVGKFESQKKLKLFCDSAMGDSKNPPLTLGLDTSAGKNRYFPRTLLKENIKHNSVDIYPIKIVFKKEKHEKVYSEISFKSNDLTLDEFLKNHKEQLIGNRISPHLIENSIVIDPWEKKLKEFKDIDKEFELK